MEEIKILRQVGNHPNVVSMVDYFEDEHEFYLVMEECTGGDLFSEIVKRGCFSEERTKELCRQLAIGLRHIHTAGVTHRDLKPENILLTDGTDNAILRVADFGLSKILDEKQSIMKTICGTWAYCAPEVIEKKPYTPEVDNWTLGVLMFILLAGYHPFDVWGNTPEPELLRKVVDVDYNFKDPAWDSISQDAMDLIKKLIRKEPEQRLSLSDYLESDWIKTSKGYKQQEDEVNQQMLERLEVYQKNREKQRQEAIALSATDRYAKIIQKRGRKMSRDFHGDEVYAAAAAASLVIEEEEGGGVGCNEARNSRSSLERPPQQRKKLSIIADDGETTLIPREKSNGGGSSPLSPPPSRTKREKSRTFIVQTPSSRALMET